MPEDGSISLMIPGEPKGKQRPRFSRATGRTYTPEQTITFENYVKALYYASYQDRKIDGPVRAAIQAVFPLPASMSEKRKKALDGMPYTKKSDADNLAKIILDALNGLAYADDKQVTELTVSKRYGRVPHTLVVLAPVPMEAVPF